MSAIHLDNRLVHYEVIGRGQPVIFLHSWLGSWRYWLPTMDHIAHRYRAYALDFWGFGESDRDESAFTVNEYVDLLRGFMDRLGIRQANLAGHGLGGMVAIRAASVEPQRFLKIMTVSTPLYGAQAQLQPPARASALSRLIGRSAPANPWARYLRQLEVDYPQIMEEIVEDTEGLSESVLQRVATSIRETDLRPDLARLELPLLAIYGERDSIVSPAQAEGLREEHRYLQQMIRLPRSSHFPFLDQPNTFNRMLLDFLASQGTPVEIKAEWRRRVSQLEYIRE